MFFVYCEASGEVLTFHGKTPKKEYCQFKVQFVGKETRQEFSSVEQFLKYIFSAMSLGVRHSIAQIMDMASQHGLDTSQSELQAHLRTFHGIIKDGDYYERIRQFSALGTVYEDLSLHVKSVAEIRKLFPDMSNAQISEYLHYAKYNLNDALSLLHQYDMGQEHNPF